jgi:hypothetical protein
MSREGKGRAGDAESLFSLAPMPDGCCDRDRSVGARTPDDVYDFFFRHGDRELCRPLIG